MMPDMLTNLIASSSGGGFWMPPDASTTAHRVDALFNFITGLSAVFFIGIVAAMFWFMWRYRRRSHTQVAESQVSHNTPLEVTWTIIPLILVIAIFYAGMSGYIELRQAPAGAEEINVTAQKWTWTFEHRNGCQQVGELYVPVGRPVKLIMSSKDVLHSCFIPAFRMKQDVVPGRLTTMWFQVTEPGDYDLFCAEYCGTDHSQMTARVHAYEEEEYQAAIAECARWIDDIDEDRLGQEAGPRLYLLCKSCHSLDGTTLTGPTWQDLWARTQEGQTTFTDGTTLENLVGPGRPFTSYEDYLYQSIVNPQQKIVMNFTASMPTFKGQLGDRELKSLVEFIKIHDEQFDSAGNLLPEFQRQP